MKNSLLCVLCLLLSSTTAHTILETVELNAVATEDSFSNLTPFDAHAFLRLIEEYTHFTKTEPKNVSEELAIMDLIQRLTDANNRIETEIKKNKILNNGIVPKKIEERLRYYSDSAKTALKELYKRQNLVKSLARNAVEIVEQASLVTHSTLLGSGRLNASYQFVKNIFPARTRIKECLLNSPMLTSC